jgi:hypothetical protein
LKTHREFRCIRLIGRDAVVTQCVRILRGRSPLQRKTIRTRRDRMPV